MTLGWWRVTIEDEESVDLEVPEDAAHLEQALNQCPFTGKSVEIDARVNDYFLPAQVREWNLFGDGRPKFFYESI